MRGSERVTIWVAIAWARLYRALRWPGLVGLAMMLAAAVVYGSAHMANQAAGQSLAHLPPAVLAGNAEALPSAAAQPLPPLPSADDAAALLRTVQQTILANGLTWASASYQYMSVSDDGLATMEIQTTLKGPYLKIKKSIGTLLDAHPAMALRELNLSRGSVDSNEVEAKIRLVVYLADGWHPTQQEVAR